MKPAVRDQFLTKVYAASQTGLERSFVLPELRTIPCRQFKPKSYEL